MALLCVSVCLFWGPDLSGTCIFLHLHRVLTPGSLCDRSVPHSMAPVRFLAGWCTHRGLVHPQPVSSVFVFIYEPETVKDKH